MYVTNCRHFTGHKPCPRHPTCDTTCPHKSLIQTRILFIHLGALGAVLRSTALLPAIHRKYPAAHLTWVTDSPGQALLENHPLIDRVVTTNDLLPICGLEFDVALVVDKSIRAQGILKQTTVDQIFGFIADPLSGAILPATPAAEELWHLGLDNHRKFFINKKTENQLIHEALELGPWLKTKDPQPDVFLSAAELALVAERKKEWSSYSKTVIGINTGCSSTIPYKKLSIEGHIQLIERLYSRFKTPIVLLGGKEDTERNQNIASSVHFKVPVIQSPTVFGLRDGLVSTAACDIVITGDSLGMHMAIALRKWVVAWFGPTCSHEIDLFGRGSVVITSAPCSPCWKNQCTNSPMCFDLVSIDELVAQVSNAPSIQLKNSENAVFEVAK